MAKIVKILFFLNLKRFGYETLQNLKLGIPVIIAQLLQIMMQFVDTVMAGHISSNDLAGLAIATALFHPVFLLMLGILFAVREIISQLYGTGNSFEIAANVIQSLWLSQALAFISICIFVYPEPVLNLMGYEIEVIRVAVEYLRALCWGMPAVYAYIILRMFNEGLTYTRPNMYISLLGLGINIIANYTLMFGHFGFPALGAVGAGWSTSFVNWVMLAVLGAYCLKSNLFKSYRNYLSFKRPKWIFLKEILRIGIPNGLSLTTEVGMFAIVSLMIGTFGATAMSGHQIAINIASLSFMVPLGLSIAISIRVGHAKGAMNYKNVRYIGFSGIFLCIIVMALTASLFILAPGYIVRFYTNEENVQTIAVQLLFMAAIFQLSDGMQVGALGALRGLKDTRVPFLANFLAYCAIGLPLAYLLGFHFHFGPTGMWVGIIVGLSIAGVMHCLRFNILTHRLLKLTNQQK